jgi:hypothetical protein
MDKRLVNLRVEGSRILFVFDGQLIDKEGSPSRITRIRHALRWRRAFRCGSCYLRQSGGCGCCSENRCVGCGRELFNTALNK